MTGTSFISLDARWPTYGEGEGAERALISTSEATIVIKLEEIAYFEVSQSAQDSGFYDVYVLLINEYEIVDANDDWFLLTAAERDKFLAAVGITA